MNKTYLNLTIKKEFTGKDINSAKVGKFIRLIRNGEKVLVPVSQVKINDSSVYRLADAESVIKIYPTDKISMTKEEYNDIMNHGNKIIEDLFGDIINIK